MPAGIVNGLHVGPLTRDAVTREEQYGTTSLGTAGSMERLASATPLWCLIEAL
jgi:hypothetical protein